MNDCCLTTHISKYMLQQLTTTLMPKCIAVVLSKDKLTTTKKKFTL